MTMAARMASHARTLSGFLPAAGLCLALAHGLLSPRLAHAASPTAAFIACAAEKDDSRRLACFDAAVAASSKNSEAMLKLANEAFQPISTRVSLAVEKIKKAA